MRTVAVLDQDFDGGQLAEQSLDYMAQDEQGNVWYLGSYTEELRGRAVRERHRRLAGRREGGKAGDPDAGGSANRNAAVLR